MCPFHVESTPSCAIYEKGNYYSFCCGKSGLVKDLPLDLQISVNKTRQKFTIDINKEINRIESLPVKEHRGLEFHMDALYYYVVWPNKEYFKKRSIIGKTDKYRCATGLSKQIFELPGSYRNLLVVEGEINALSAYKARPDMKIVSPGSATDFMRYIDLYDDYNFIYIAFDNDAAGGYNASKLRDALMARKKFVFLHPMKKDFNDLLTQGGVDEVRREIDTLLGVQTNLRNIKTRENLQLS